MHMFFDFRDTYYYHNYFLQLSFTAINKCNFIIKLNITLASNLYQQLLVYIAT